MNKNIIKNVKTKTGTSTDLGGLMNYVFKKHCEKAEVFSRKK